MTPVQLPEVPALIAARGFKPHLWCRESWFCWPHRRVTMVPEEIDCDGYGDTPQQAYADLMANIAALNAAPSETNSER